MKLYMFISVLLITNCSAPVGRSNVASSSLRPASSHTFAGVTLSKPLPKDPNLAVKSPVISTSAKTAPKPSSKTNVKKNTSTTTTKKTPTQTPVKKSTIKKKK